MRDVQRTGEGCGLRGGAGGKWVEYLLDVLRAFDINAGQWKTAVQDGEE